MGVALFGFFVRHTETALFMRGVEQALVTSALLLLVGAAIALRNLNAATQTARPSVAVDSLEADI